jgi:hypothetical protein
MSCAPLADNGWVAGRMIAFGSNVLHLLLGGGLRHVLCHNM